MTASSTPKPGRTVQGSRSAQGLATVGLGNFKIGAMHDVLQNDLEEQEDGFFFPGGLGVPESFQGNETEDVGYLATVGSILIRGHLST